MPPSAVPISARSRGPIRYRRSQSTARKRILDPGVPCVGSNPGNVVRVGSQSPVGDGKWGHSDLGGNVWEWMLDWVDVYPVPCDDCADLTSNTVRGFRGGAYNTTATQVRPATRGDAMPTFRDPANGVRCAR